MQNELFDHFRITVQLCTLVRARWHGRISWTCAFEERPRGLTRNARSITGNQVYVSWYAYFQAMTYDLDVMQGSPWPPDHCHAQPLRPQPTPAFELLDFTGLKLLWRTPLPDASSSPIFTLLSSLIIEDSRSTLVHSKIFHHRTQHSLSFQTFFRDSSVLWI